MLSERLLERPFSKPQFHRFFGGYAPAPCRRLVPTAHAGSQSSYEMGSAMFCKQGCDNHPYLQLRAKLHELRRTQLNLIQSKAF